MSSPAEILESELTESQYNAATDSSSEILTLACAGSGKSRTLAYRIAYLVASGEAPESIVAFTFTEKAAEAIKRSVASALEKVGVPPTCLGAMYIGTIHSYCQHILGKIDSVYRQYDVLDPNRFVFFLLSRYPQLHLAPLRGRVANRQFETLRKVAQAWNLLNDELIALEDVEAIDAPLAAALTEISSALHTSQFIDFSLMIRRVVEALEGGEPRAEEAVSSIEHLLVDEYQDVNTAQERLIRQLHRHSTTLFVVGDDDQAIYGWRGADVQNIISFGDRYPNAQTHQLLINFRSTQPIVEAANSMVSAELGAERIHKTPTASVNAQARDYRNLWFDVRAEEAAWVANQIKTLVGKEFVENPGQENEYTRGLTAGDFAILMRSTRQPENTSAPRHQAFTDALREEGIAFSLEAGGSPFDVPQVEGLRSSFALLRDGNPDRDTARNHFDEIIAPAYPHADFNQFAQTLARWGRQIHAGEGGARQRVFPQNLVHELLDAFSIQRSSFPDATMRAIGMFSKIIQDAESVYVSIDSSRRFSELLNFLGNVAEKGYDLASDDLVMSPDAVTVSTVHKMKGLEFPVVFVVDVEQNRFPKRRQRYQEWLPQELIEEALSKGCYTSHHAEEARLFYTAITRAERFLYVTGSELLPGGKRANKRSRFANHLTHDEVSSEKDFDQSSFSDAPASPRVQEAQLPTSYSEIRYYLRCPKDYQFRFRYGFSPAIVEMFGFGQTVHTAIGKLHEQHRAHPPTPEEAEQVAAAVFHLKHIPPSQDPVERPGGYERAQASAQKILREYAETYADDFTQQREIEARFEIPVQDAVISGSIDLLVKEDANGNVLDASVIDFKAMKGGDLAEQNELLNWTELALQVQLYARAAIEVLGESAQAGAVHLLKDNQRVAIPVNEEAIDAAVANVEWAVERILEGDFPMRPSATKCAACDFEKLCSQTPEQFGTDSEPPELALPDSFSKARAFHDFEDA